MKRILVMLVLALFLRPYVHAAQNGTTFTAYISTASTTLYNAPGRFQNFSIVNSSASTTQNIYFFDGAATTYSTNSVYGLSVSPANANSNGSQQINLGDSALIIRNYLSATSNDTYGNNKVQVWTIPDEGDN